MKTSILKVNGLSKQYGNVQALDNLTLDIEAGSIFGFLGPNGSGKTTTLGILLGINKADKGTFSWFNNGEKDNNRLRIGSILETPNFYPYLSAKQNLKTVGLIKKVPNLNKRIDEIIERVGLSGRARDKFRTYSLGMKQRLAIGSAMLNNPEVLVLDEPTNGLDPQGIADIRELISDIAKGGQTIIIASHILDEIEKVCSHVAILRKGKLLRNGTLADIMGAKKDYLLRTQNIELLIEALNKIQWATINTQSEDHLLVNLQDNYGGADLNEALCKAGVFLSELQSKQKNLETIFLETVRS